jgi:hypothetical protein
MSRFMTDATWAQHANPWKGRNRQIGERLICPPYRKSSVAEWIYSEQYDTSVAYYLQLQSRFSLLLLTTQGGNHG